MPKCWCGRDHSRLCDRGDIRNGNLKHGVFNWKLCEFRMVDQGQDPFALPDNNDHTQPRLPAPD